MALRLHVAALRADARSGKAEARQRLSSIPQRAAGELADLLKTANQERELREIAGRMGCEIVRAYKDHGISGTRGRDKRPAFDKLCRDAARREFDVVMAWSVDRLGRSLQDLVGFLSELHALKVDLFLQQQGLDTTTPAGKAMFQMMGVF